MWFVGTNILLVVCFDRLTGCSESHNAQVETRAQCDTLKAMYLV